MAGSSLLTLLDDIATLLDDISVMTKVAAKKTAGVLGDDLALNAEQVTGIRADRELPVVWAVAKGSFKNKHSLVPAALLISALAPWAITPLLMVGGAYLCYEGFEKLVHKFGSHGESKEVETAENIRALSHPEVDLVALEKDKIKGAVRTDFILSAEIIVIALGTVQGKALGLQVVVVSAIALLVTVGVYALVGGIVKMDDAGLHLIRRQGPAFSDRFRRMVGAALLRLAPLLMKFLSVVGTAAMFLVGGGILMHGLPGGHTVAHAVVQFVHGFGSIGEVLAVVTPLLVDGLGGMVAGGLVLGAIQLGKTLLNRFRPVGQKSEPSDHR